MQEVREKVAVVTGGGSGIGFGMCSAFASAGMKIAVVANLQPATIRGVESNGMVLAAATDDGPVLVTFGKDVPNGARVR